jgi:hypothetical protein
MDTTKDLGDRMREGTPGIPAFSDASATERYAPEKARSVVLGASSLAVARAIASAQW